MTPAVMSPAASSPAAPAKAAAANPLTLLPPDLQVQSGLHLVLDRRRRRLLVIHSGALLRQFPVAVGMPGWETPAGSFSITDMRTDPAWEHPSSGKRIPAGADNPLGSRWIGFHVDCNGRKASDGDQVLDIKGCVAAGFHGTPHRWTVGRAVSHGCVRLYDEDVRALFDMVSVGTPVTVLR
ncbi:MAG: L,D-transpeptidase [Prochlorococcaceae cyanobacterium]